MPKITDPDQLVLNTELTINTSTRRIRLNITGNLSNDGVTLQCVYSKLKELWKDNSAFIAFPFPLEPVSPKINFDLINGWDFEDDATRYLIRDGGWTLRDANGVSQEEWACIVSLGALGAADQVYFQQAANGSATNFQLPGVVNQAIKIFGDATRGNVNFRSFLKIFVREQGKTYAQASLTDIGVTALETQPYALPLVNAPDLKIVATDAQIGANAPYTGMSITYHAAPQNRTIGGTAYPFNVIINGNNATAEQIYSFVQRQLRQNADIDAGAGTVTGQTADSLLRFLGDQLITSQGVYIDNFNSNDVNRITFTDNNNAARNFPFTATLTLNFNANLTSDGSAKYFVYFASNFGTASALLVKASNNADMTGLINGQSSITLSFDYDGNAQGGRTPATDANIVVVAIGLSRAQYVRANGVIARSNSNSVSLTSNLERSYLNV